MELLEILGRTLITGEALLLKGSISRRKTSTSTSRLLLLIFNCVPDPQLDKWEDDNSFGDKGIPALHALTDQLGLEDIFRVQNPSGSLFT